MLRPFEPVSPRTRILLGIGFFVLFTAGWAVATFGGFVSPTFLADPLTMLADGWSLLADQGFLSDIGMTVWRVVGGFAMAAVIAFFLPNTFQIMTPQATDAPIRAGIRAVAAAAKLSWQPRLATAILVGCLGAFAVAAISRTSPFIYFNF